MKKAFGLVFAIVAMHAHAAEDKMYVTPDHIVFEKSAIFVLVNNNWAQAPALYSDQNGLYVEGFKILPWYCTNCNRWTSGFFVCEHCGSLPPS